VVGTLDVETVAAGVISAATDTAGAAGGGAFRAGALVAAAGCVAEPVEMESIACTFMAVTSVLVRGIGHDLRLRSRRGPSPEPMMEDRRSEERRSV
jgi:hypothetical protein